MVSVDKFTNLQAKAEEMVSGFGTSTAWKDITLQCSDTGGSGLAPEMPDQPQAPKLSLKGDFNFVDNGAPKCTRHGKALVSFKTNKSGNIHYSLDCTNGYHLSGVAQTVKSPQGGYVATAMHTFDVTKTIVYSCALKAAAPGPARLHQWKSHKFDCVNRAVETGSNDIKVAPKPQSGNSRVPATLVPNVLDKMKADALTLRLEAAKKVAQAEKQKALKKEAKRKTTTTRKRDAAVSAVQSRGMPLR